MNKNIDELCNVITEEHKEFFTTHGVNAKMYISVVNGVKGLNTELSIRIPLPKEIEQKIGAIIVEP